MMYWITKPFLWVLFQLTLLVCGGLKAEGRDNVPREGGVLITPNHISDADPPTVYLALPRPCYTMAKEELFQMRIIGPIIRWMHGFPIKRNTADRSALRYTEGLLARGEAVVMFPEGQLSEDGELQQMLPGALLIASHAKVPIVPTAIIGTNALMPYGKVTPRRIGRPVIVRFGPPVTLDQLTGGARGGEALRRGADRLRECVRAVVENRPYPPLDAAPEPAQANDARQAAPAPS
jgi:1-acyl-sn-glycerol-3-phosphate acyltransferase